MTLVEALLAALLGCVVTAILIGLMVGLAKMGQASELSNALQEAGLAMATIQDDLGQAVQKADPSVPFAVIVKPDRFQLIRAAFQPDGSVTDKLVTYHAVGTPGGNFRLTRTCEGSDRGIPGTFRGVTFGQYEATGGPFVRVTLRVAAVDTAGGDAAAKGSQEAVLSAIVRVMGPEGVDSSLSSWPNLSALKAIELFTSF